MRKSIGAKIFTVMAIMGLLFVVGLAVNLSSLNTISNDSEQVSLYLTMEQTKGVVSTAFQQAQLYANLTYFKKDTAELPVVHGKLKTAVEQMTTYMEDVKTLAVERLAENAEKMLQFVDDKIMTDYDGFVSMVQQYAKDAENMNQIISEFSRNAGGINDIMESINVGINDIAIAVDESAKGVTSVAEGSTELVSAMVKIGQETEANMTLAEKLSEEVNKFKRV